jgi:hypothetical protein
MKNKEKYMEEEYYKLYGEKTGKIAGTMRGKEEYVKQLCDDLNNFRIGNEKITYAKIEIEEYKELRKNRESKIMKEVSNKPVNLTEIEIN